MEDSAYRVPRNFVGINVASSADPACDDYVISRVRDLGIGSVRLDFTYTSFGSFQERFLRRVLDEDLHVMLHLVAPPDEARRLACDAHTRERWRAFVVRVFDQFDKRAAMFEIGSTPNRRQWSGYGIRGYLAAWKIANEAARGRELILGGPNVSDFEPLYNFAMLALMRRSGFTPAVHTDNLFVERAVEPEAYDRRVAGRLLGRAMRLDLPAKARILAGISARFGIRDTICTHVAWSLRRIERFQQFSEEKQADYLVRYLLLAAAGGALRKVYWGPLIGQREGLIDDGTQLYPDLPRVALHDRVLGDLGQYRERPAYAALRNAVRLISDARVVRSETSGDVHTVEFVTSQGVRLHTAWTRDRRIAKLTQIFSATDHRAPHVLERDGACPTSRPVMVSESPIFLMGEVAANEGRVDESAQVPDFRAARSLNVPSLGGYQFVPVECGRWRGAVTLGDADDCKTVIGRLMPEFLERLPESCLLRDSRNRVWVVPDTPAGRKLVVKRSDVSVLPMAPTKARQAWNNSSEMIRRGIHTPMPVAFFEPRDTTAPRRCYYVCEFVEGAWSARQAFESLCQGTQMFEGIDQRALFAALASFVRKMHARGVFHRDLSAGNLLLRRNPGDGLDLWTVDTARAIFCGRALGEGERLADLMRLCHPLDLNDRELLVGAYRGVDEAALSGWRRVPFIYYDVKHAIKNAIRGLR